MVSPSSSGGLKDAKSTTSALRRTRVVMDRNLTRLDAAMSQLSQDGELISESLNEHSVELKGALRSTKKNLHAVKRAEMWERYSLKASLVFFFSTVAYIICKRTRLLALALFACNRFVFQSPSDMPEDLSDSLAKVADLRDTLAFVATKGIQVEDIKENVILNNKKDNSFEDHSKRYCTSDNICDGIDSKSDRKQCCTDDEHRDSTWDGQNALDMNTLDKPSGVSELDNVAKSSFEFHSNDKKDTDEFHGSEIEVTGEAVGIEGVPESLDDD